MTKAIWIDDRLHDRVKTYAFNRREAIGTLTEALWVEHLNNAVQPSNEPAQNPIIIEKKAVGRPAGKKWKMPHCEVAAMVIKNIPERPEQPDPGVITLKWRIEDNTIMPENNQTAIIIDVSGFYFGMPASEFAILTDLNGAENLIEVNSRDFTPGNELAKKILSWMPGRESFSKHLLFILAKSGFAIRYID